jgi:hypothetical protein
MQQVVDMNVGRYKCMLREIIQEFLPSYFILGMIICMFWFSNFAPKIMEVLI